MKIVVDSTLLSRAQVAAHLRLPLYRNAYALIFSAATTSALGMLYWVLAARYYDTAVVGLNTAAISAMMFLSGISRLYLEGALIRFLPRAGSAASRLVRYSYLVSEAVALLVGLIFLLGLPFWSPALGFLASSPLLFWGFLIAVMAATLSTLQDSVLTGMRQAIWVPVENTIFALAKILLLVAFASLFPAYGIFASWTIPMVVMLLPVNVLIFRYLMPGHMRQTAAAAEPVPPARVARFVGGNYLGYLFQLSSTRLLPLIVLHYVGSQGNAYFFLPWTIVLSLQLVASSMTSSLTVEAVTDERGLAGYARRALLQSARLLVPVVLVVLAGAPYIMRLFGSDYSIEGAGLLRLLVLGTLPALVNSLCLGIARVRQQVGVIIVVQALLCLMVLGLSSLFLPTLGIEGVGWAWLASHSIMAAILAVSHFLKLR
jgi:O-antigen/teichoic acid export membrane protein